MQRAVDLGQPPHFDSFGAEPFGNVMRDLSHIFRRTYSACSVALVPGSAMHVVEAVAGQFCAGGAVGMLQNCCSGWAMVDDLGPAVLGVAESAVLLTALPADSSSCPTFAPHPLHSVKEFVAERRLKVVVAPYVETTSGMILSMSYIAGLANAIHDAGGLLVLDGRAAGATWLDMRRTGVDIYIADSQKAWGGPPCAGIVMLSERARLVAKENTVGNLSRWLEVMEACEKGASSCLDTAMPADKIRALRDATTKREIFGVQRLEMRCWRLGRLVRDALSRYGFKSVAAPGFQAPDVVVCYADATTFARDFHVPGLEISSVRCFMNEELDCRHRLCIGLSCADELRGVDEVMSSLEAALGIFRNNVKLPYMQRSSKLSKTLKNKLKTIQKPWKKLRNQ